MGKKNGTIENRVYLFREMATAFVGAQSELLASNLPGDRARAMRALGDIAHAASAVADSEGLSADQLRELVQTVPRTPPQVSMPRVGRRRRTKDAAPEVEEGEGKDA